MDLASIIGLIACLVLVIFGIVTGDEGAAALLNFLHAPSALITFGGAFACILASNSISDFIGGLKSMGLIFKSPAMDTPEIIKKIIELSNVARKEGLLSLVRSVERGRNQTLTGRSGRFTSHPSDFPFARLMK